jgi:hypothetical protein
MVLEEELYRKSLDLEKEMKVNVDKSVHNTGAGIGSVLAAGALGAAIPGGALLWQAANGMTNNLPAKTADAIVAPVIPGANQTQTPDPSNLKGKAEIEFFTRDKNGNLIPVPVDRVPFEEIP